MSFFVLRELNASVVSLVVLAVCASLSSCSGDQLEAVNFPLEVKKEMGLPVSSEVVAIAWSLDGAKLAAATDLGGTLTVWDRSGRQLSRASSHADGPAIEDTLAFTPDSSQLLFNINDRNFPLAAFDLIDPQTGISTKKVDGPSIFKDSPWNSACCLRVAPDGRAVAVAPNRDTSGAQKQDSIFFYDTMNWHIEHSVRIEGIVSSINYFAGGTKIVIGTLATDPNTATVYVVGSGGDPTVAELTISGLSNAGVTAVAGSPDGQFVFVGIDGGGHAPHESHGLPADSVARILRVSDGVQVASFLPARGPIRMATWDPKNRYVAFLDSGGDLYVWRPFVPTPSYVRIHLRPAASLAMSPDGRRLAADAGRLICVFVIQ